MYISGHVAIQFFFRTTPLLFRAHMSRPSSCLYCDDDDDANGKRGGGPRNTQLASYDILGRQTEAQDQVLWERGDTTWISSHTGSCQI